MPNTIEIKDKKVVKHFESRMNFVREQSIYQKLKNTGLAPEVTGMWDGAIEHAYIEGDDYEKYLRESMSDPYKYTEAIKLFFDWYIQFREKLNISIGDTEFCDFIVADNRLCCIDFEHCKPGYVEYDIASIAAQICLTDNAYTLVGIEDAKIFVKMAWEKLDMSSEKLYNAIKDALTSRCKQCGIAVMNAANEYFACFVCCSFVHKPESADILGAVKEVLKCSKQMWTLFADNVTGSDEKYIRYLMGAEKGEKDIFYLNDSGTVLEFPLLLKTESALKTLEFAISMELNLKEGLMFQLNAKSVSIENIK